ncbi:MHS family proline/betaine transporter-like MFS transporter [Mycobacterium frederiksbergense]|uniref:MHS family proline/betaine transporter-like MFS transporter n=1 Tax=Mycolicibacterium frederiksbergense TaxID=117567 RepID=A0ABT6KXU1_9MYCO|nr:MFS transporter [Mycolicibacterium frederiksbergense]MDH6195518.1 MHS family proline/betaine transporter-like MFS transporter [Mycolicibacterium frederiksbergense]
MNTNITADASATSTLPPITRDADLSPEQRRVVRRSIAGSAIGNAIEWFDYGVYGYMVTTMATLFFSFGGDQGTAWPRILAFGTFALSFLVRPLGALVLGPLGDRVGRRAVLVTTILLISVSTAAIGLLPTYESIGIWAPLLLVFLRMLQGFSAGGEYAGSAVFMAEHAPDNRRGFYGSFLEFATFGGFCTAAILCTSLTVAVGREGMLDGWWRLPFLITLPLGLIGLWMRRNAAEPETFVEDVARETKDLATRGGLRKLIAQYPGQLIKLMGFVVCYNVAFYLVLTYMPTYLSATLGQDAILSDITLVAIQVVMMIVIVPIGALSDRVGRKPPLIVASLGFMILSVPAVMLCQMGSTWSVFVGIGILGLLLTIYAGTASATLPALFPTAVRYSGFAIGYNVSTAMFGGTAAMANEMLIDSTGNPLIPGWYLAIAGAIGLISVLTFRETAGRSLRGNVIPGTDDSLRRAAGETLIGDRKNKRSKNG